MKDLLLYITLFVLGCFLLDIHALPINNEQPQEAVFLSQRPQADLSGSTKNPVDLIAPSVPLSLLDAEESNNKFSNKTEEYQRSTRGLGGFGGLGGLGSKFGGVGLGFKGFGNLGGWGFGGIHGLGLGGLKMFFGKHFG